MNMNKTTLAPLSLASLTILAGTILASSIVSADNDSVVDEISITVPVSCTLGGTGMDAHNAEINNGTYNSAIGETTLKAFCNDNEGFAIYAIGYTDNEEGKNVLTNSTLGSTYDITTGTAITGNDSKWAMKLSTITSPTPTYPIIIAGSTEDSLKAQDDPDYSTFQEVPDDYEKVAYRTSATDTGTNAEGTTLTTTYQAYISKTQPAGTYTGQVKYTLVHPHDGTAPAVPISIEKAYEKNGKQKHNGYYKMQEMSDSICSIVTLYDDASQTQLIDTRDNKTYYVAKLQDGNCWMTQNLDHDIVTDGSVVYDNTTTDLGWNSNMSSYGTASWAPLRATYATNTTTWCQGGTLQDDNCQNNFTPESYDPGELYWSGTPGDATPISSGNPHYHLGNYYNWTAAVALNDSSSYSASGDSVDQSICPANWKLSNYLEFQNLITQYGFNPSSFEMMNPYIWETPIKVFPSGSWKGSLRDLGSDGVIWHPSVYSSTIAYGSEIYVGIVLPGYTMFRATGYSVRCVAR